MKNNKTLELLAPAGNTEKLKYAFEYGADAVYAGVPDFSLRARINDFTPNKLKKGIEYAHQKGKKFYITINIYAHNIHLKQAERHLKFLKKLDIDGIIVSDPGILTLVKKNLPNVNIHLSTQANALNWRAVKFWGEQGAKRVILARETTLKEIKEIKKKVPEVELEYLVHGAMCMSYSGRCILSQWMTGRSANLGDCAQPCRWKYSTVTDSQKKFEIDLEEDKNGTYFFNSRDLNLLAYLNDLRKAGVTFFKIEGRNKSVFYLSVVVRAYRKVLDAVLKKKPKQEIQKIIREEQKELNKLFRRGYTAGFLLGNEPEHFISNSHKKCLYEFVGEVIENKKLKVESKKNENLIKIKPHNAVYKNDKIEIISPDGNQMTRIKEIYNESEKVVQSAHGGQNKFYYLNIGKKNIKPMSLLRKKIKNTKK
ncbi:U32 family peptidase [bacterium]|nr:U32 family peptidase [bacterium]